MSAEYLSVDEAAAMLDGFERSRPGPCALCGADPARGFASITVADVERWYCHDDDADCYADASLMWMQTRSHYWRDSISGEPTSSGLPDGSATPLESKDG